MATVNLGRIKPVFRGAYNNSTAYVIDDIVTSGNETFIAIAATQGNATSDASKWTKLAAKGVDGTDIGTTLTTQGDILFRDGSGLQRLAIGTAGQILKVNSGATALEYGADEGGKILQVVHSKNSNGTTISAQNSFTDVSGSSISITPTATSSKILHIWNTGAYGSDNSGMFTFQVFRDSTEIRKVGLGAHNLNNEGSTSGATTITLDEPSTTSQITYKIKGAKSGSGNPLYVNQQSNLNGQHNILIEIGG